MSHHFYLNCDKQLLIRSAPCIDNVFLINNYISNLLKNIISIIIISSLNVKAYLRTHVPNRHNYNLLKCPFCAIRVCSRLPRNDYCVLDQYRG